MTLYSLIFYILAAVILISTGFAITRRNMIHAVLYLVISFFGTAMLFYLMGAPLLAALEVIIYAGAIMILFLFIIMMLRVEGIEERLFPLKQWLPALGLGFISLQICIFLLISAGPEAQEVLKTAVAEPAIFGHFLFTNHWLSIEIVSMLLLIALVGVFHLGMDKKRRGEKI